MSGLRWKGRRTEVERRRREGRKGGVSGRRGAEPSRRPGRPRAVRRPSAVRRRAPGAGSWGNAPRPGAGCRPGDERPADRPGSGQTPSADRPGNESEPPEERSGNGSRPPVGSPGNGRRRPGAAGSPGCRRSGSRCAGSRRSAGVRRGAGRWHRPRRNHARGSDPPAEQDHARGPSRSAGRSHAPGCGRARPGRNHGRGCVPPPSHPNHARGRARPPGRSLARGRPGCRNCGCSPRCWAHPPHPGAVRPESRPASAKASPRAPRTGEAECWIARAHPPRVAGAGGVAGSDRSRSRARDPGGAGEPRSLPRGRGRAEGPSRTLPVRTDTYPARTRTPPAPRRRTGAPVTAAEAGRPASRGSLSRRPLSWRPLSRSRCRGPEVWTGGAGRAGVGGWRHDALPCSCTPRFLVPGRPGGRPGVRPPVGSDRHAYLGHTPPTVRQHHGQAIPVAADPHPRRGRPCVRVTLRAGPARTGTDPSARGFCPERPPTLR